MEILTTVAALDQWTEGHSASETVGLVPTMGALHKGHLALVERARAENDRVVVTVFVNPIQFNNATDLQRYPRTFEADRDLLEKAGVDVMFFPSVDEVYPTSERITYDLDGLDASMEGPLRPGHFHGVVQVVSRFFELVRPTTAYFGEKDFQQLAIIRHMMRKLGHDVRVVGCPTVREDSGLAMSSRNQLLTEEWAERAPLIYQVLSSIGSELDTKGTSKTRARSMETLDNAGFRTEYVELVHPDTLKPIGEGAAGPVQACVAAWAGDVRLIDNLRVK